MNFLTNNTFKCNNTGFEWFPNGDDYPNLASVITNYFLTLALIFNHPSRAVQLLTLTNVAQLHRSTTLTGLEAKKNKLHCTLA